jgi:hypothetical protein
MHSRGPRKRREGKNNPINYIYIYIYKVTLKLSLQFGVEGSNIDT